MCSGAGRSDRQIRRETVRCCRRSLSHRSWMVSDSDDSSWESHNSTLRFVWWHCPGHFGMPSRKTFGALSRSRPSSRPEFGMFKLHTLRLPGRTGGMPSARRRPRPSALPSARRRVQTWVCEKGGFVFEINREDRAKVIDILQHNGRISLTPKRVRGSRILVNFWC